MILVHVEAGRNIKGAVGGNLMQEILKDLGQRIGEMRDYL